MLAPTCLVTATTFAVDAPKLPAIATYSIEQSERHTSFSEGAIAKKKELLFSDDFERAGEGVGHRGASVSQSQRD